MRDEDRRRFYSALMRLASHYDKRLTDRQVASWWDQMSRTWSIEEFETACRVLLDRCQFMPRPFDFAELRRSRDTAAEDAWLLVRRHIRGPWRERASCGDPIADRAVATLGGYETLAYHTPPEFMAHRFDKFREIYDGLRERGEIREALPPNVQSLLEHRQKAKQLEVAEGGEEDES